ncbi:RNA polymerase sigma factor FecI [Nitrospira sp. KM1]|uniref:sigma-70 family RNA polymerase sigma factor n=1 Tax=Nitrospira sp. KM1 TaxID=1936990 RepID=UPI0013A7672A|nr:sigma-70 family RNA polymerase sigma factor [Nitrospira sp. KM1]BCA57163.1 RNA polymerase sigma factor FecI [Nitrospira sp. KM1]
MDNQAGLDRFSLFREYYDELLSYLTLRLQSRDQAKDITQETFLRALAQDSPVAIRQPRAFLYKIAVNLTVDLFRKKQRQAEESLDAEELRDVLVAPARQCEDAESREETRLLYDAVLELPPRCREVFLLHLFKDLSHAEIAAHFGISKSMVEKHILKATVYCRNKLKDR